jgi:chromosome segregation ATPase
MDGTAVIALVGTLCGGLGLKLVEHWLGRNKARLDEASKIREELRDQIDDMRIVVREVETARDKWREDYFALREKYVELQAQLAGALEQLRMLKEKLEAIDKSGPTVL